jgi:putative ABC transport system permease protein
MVRLLDILRISLRQVVRQWRRYAGVIVAIALGIAGLIAVKTLSRDVKEKINRDLELLGGCTLVKAFFDPPLPNGPGSSRPQWFRRATLEALRRLPGVGPVSLAAVKEGVCSLWRGRRQTFTLVGVDAAYWEANSFTASSGTLFGAEDVERRRRVCVLGAELARRIFGGQPAEGALLPIEGSLYRVVGTLGGLGLGDRTEFAFLPLTTVSDRIAGPLFPDRLHIRCLSWDDVEAVAAAIPAGVAGSQPAERLRVVYAREQLKRVQRIVWWIEMLAHVSVAVTFVLGGFGIWNGMMSAVQTRTREIGLKKAMGAEDRDILAQFLSESLILSLGAALLGVGAGRIVTQVTGRLLQSPPPEDLFLGTTLIGLLFALIVGLGAGFVPALRASRMQVVQAIRYE